MKPTPLWARWKQRLPDRATLKQKWFYRFFGRTIFHPDLWSFQARPVAGGIALGLFVAFTPTFGIQMFIVAMLAFFLRVNLPLGVAATWITNVATAPFFYYLCYKVGVVLQGGGPSSAELAPFAGKWKTFVMIAQPLWLGSLFVGTAMAALGYLLSLLIWSWQNKIRSYRSLKKRAEAEAPLPAEKVAGPRGQACGAHGNVRLGSPQSGHQRSLRGVEKR